MTHTVTFRGAAMIVETGAHSTYRVLRGQLEGCGTGNSQHKLGRGGRMGCHRKSHAHQGDSPKVQPALVISSSPPLVTSSWLCTALT